MTNYSLTYTGAIAMLVASLTFLTEAEALNLINAGLVIAGFIATAYGRYRAGGVNALGVRR